MCKLRSKCSRTKILQTKSLKIMISRWYFAHRVRHWMVSTYISFDKIILSNVRCNIPIVKKKLQKYLKNINNVHTRNT